LKENLAKRTKKKKDKVVSMLSNFLLIKHKDSKLEYTISKIVVDDGKPSIIAYRYYSKPSSNKKVYVKIPLKDFKDYETV
jgi:hypothetical protein